MTNDDVRGFASPPRPRKRLGQHFLIDQNIVRKIIEVAALQPDEPVFEVGPGRGILTRALCGRVRLVIAIEIDRDLHAYLTSALADCGALDLRPGDALSFPYQTLPDRTVVVANLPYNISTPLLFKFFEFRARISRIILMLQAEVAERLVAKPGTRDYGVLSVLTQFWTVPALGFRVSPSCFRPRPAVGSTVVALVVRESPAVPVSDEATFVRCVRAAFAHRRKTLLNSLRDEGFPVQRVAGALERVGIATSRRAETVSLEEFAALADKLTNVAPLEG